MKSKNKSKEAALSIDEKLRAALVPEAEQPYPIPGKWVWTKMGAITRIVGGGTPRSHDPALYEDGAIPWIRPVDLSGYDDMYISQGSRNITEEGLRNSSARLIPKNSLLFSSRAPIGYVAISANEVTTSQGFKSFLPTSALVPQYGYWYLKSAKPLAESLASGTTFQEISGAKATLIPIPLPPLSEQQRIAEKLESLLGKIKEAKTLLDEIPEILQNFRQIVLAAACSGRLTEDWREKNPDVLRATGSGALSGRGTASPLQNDLPETWVASRFDQVFDINPGHKNIPIDNNLNISFVPMNLIEEETGKINTNISKKYKEVKNGYTKFIEDDVLFAKITPCMENGKIAIAQNLINGIGCGTTELHVFRPFIKGMSKYLFYFLLQKTIREQAKRRFQGTSGHMRVPSEFFHDLFFPLPPLEEQTEIVRRVESLFSKADDLEVQYKDAMELIETLPEIILSKAFRGELVPQDPNDEPAFGLLERITFEKEKHETEKVEGTKRKKHKQSV